ncbi:MAG TPA: hypothetical protein VGK10_12075 [Prolixibacteraceae bacterium]
MKYLLILAVMVWGLMPLVGQSETLDRYELGVVRNDGPSRRVLVFKPHRMLRIKTSDGRHLSSRHYSFTQGQLILDARDTVLFHDIEWVRGKVHGNVERKLLGVGLIGYSAISALVFATVVYEPLVIVAGGAFLTVYGGTGFWLAGARKFRSSHDWELSLIEQ